MFDALTAPILADMDRFQALSEADPNDPRCRAIVAALEKSAAAFDRWAAEADPALRKEKQTLYAGLLAAAQICQGTQR
jgi:ABC-type siderophore export system fused ATPase/permease subunit